MYDEIQGLELKSKIPVMEPKPFEIIETPTLPEPLFDFPKNLNQNRI